MTLLTCIMPTFNAIIILNCNSFILIHMYEGKMHVIGFPSKHFSRVSFEISTVYMYVRV